MAAAWSCWIGLLLPALGAAASFPHVSAPAAAATDTGRALLDGTQLLQASAGVARVDSVDEPHGRVSAGSASTIHRRGASQRNPAAQGRLLLFFAVGSRPNVRNLVVSNINHAKASLDISADVYLAHYDSNREEWKATLGNWYTQNVRYSAETKGLKFWLARDLLLIKQRKEHPELFGRNWFSAERLKVLPVVNIHDYEFLWILDEDASFVYSDLGKMLRLARQSGASIMTPAFRTLEGKEAMMVRDTDSLETGCQAGDRDCRMQSPDASCTFRRTDYVEVSFTLMTAQAFEDVIGSCFECFPIRGSTWGLSWAWCNLAADIEGRGQNETCAILDGAPIVHMNAKTHTKYTEGTKSSNMDDNAKASFITSHTLKQFKCQHRTYSCEREKFGWFR